ncbi:LacI family DNA-binding transcriptional regulator [Phycicoccus flavus]|uniref:LacI family DNA-binding transcriptional regulator n=1 Tax=Phycicoccus flavus TaxID=2502783 RepID=UPI000FEBA6B8|nr:substrate-binding domain-containing protein [Phycicoccus flavus]NHA67840.1 LacI family transcriptional regulator [Phycicoccus flavus]
MARTTPTVRAVAAEAGVSIATVSRVLNDARHVAPGTREAVRAALDRLAPTGRDGVPAGRVFLRCPYTLTDYFGLLVSSAAETLEAEGFEVVLEAGESAQHRDSLATLATRPRVTGALLLLPPETPEALVAVRRAGLPLVVLDPRTPPPADVAAVSAAHLSGARQCTRHLLGLGHRRIALLRGPAGWVASSERAAGHAAALLETGMLPDPALVRQVEATTADGQRAGGELLDLPEPPTAVVAFNDKVALGVLRAAEARGLHVPEQVSVTGFDDIDLARATAPQLTTVRQPLAEMGRIAVGLLSRLMRGSRVEALHVELATTLLPRGSTGPSPL